MDAGRASASALATSLIRAVHTRCDRPTLVDDPYGDVLVTDAERVRLLDRFLLMLGDAQREEIGAIPDHQRAFDLAARALPAYAGILVRTRYTEDGLAAAMTRGVRQYVLVGAGMDTFALRRPDLRDRLRVIEIDHPATQALKRRRLVQAGLSAPPNLHFAAADLETESVGQALSRSPYLAEEPAFFAWLGVTPYLTREANLGTLHAIAECSVPGSELVFDYLELDAFAPERAAEETRRLVAERATSGEPFVSGFDPRMLPQDLRQAGLALVEDLGPEDAEARYCAGRADRLRMPAHAHIACARVATDAAERIGGP